MDKPPVIECIGLGIDFGGLTALDDFNFTLGRTEIGGLIGPNGAGKTTVFNLLTKVYQPSRGKMIFDGKDTQNMNNCTSKQGGNSAHFQNIRLYKNYGVGETCSFLASITK
jgi:branched-chain amino acid transport system ATP-binding protein